MADAGWIRYKSRAVLGNTIAGMRHWAGRPCANRVARPLEGVPAFIVGAGAVLEHNGHLLPAAARCGVVFALNSSAPCAAAYGVTPDVLVSRESVDCSAQIAECAAPVVVLDVGCHAASWTAAGGRAAWYLPGYPRHLDWCQILSVSPIFSGTAASTAAVALALRWGADPIVLVGCGMAFEPDGRAYHPAAPRGAMRGVLSDEGRRITLTSDEWAMDNERRSGQDSHSRELTPLWVDPWGRPGATGEEVPTLSTLVDEIDWLSETAYREEALSGRMFVNASEGGAHVACWRHERLGDVLERLPVRPVDGRLDALLTALDRARMSDEEMGVIRARTTEEAETLRAISSAMLAPGGPRWSSLRATPGTYRGTSFVEALAAADLVDLNTTHPPGVERIRYAYEAWGRAAEAAHGDDSGHG